MRYRLPVGLLLCATGCTTGPLQHGVLLFCSGFEKSSAITADLSRIGGTDQITAFSWDDIAKNSGIIDHYYVYLVSATPLTDFITSETVSMVGRFGKPTMVLHHQVKKIDPTAPAPSRNEYSFFYDTENPANTFKEGFVRYWMKLPEDLDKFLPINEPLKWLMITEWKEPSSDNIGPTGGTNNYRINIHINKDKGTSRLHWYAQGQQVQPDRQTEWELRNYKVPVPLGQWFKVDLYLKKHASAGRVYFAVNGTVVFDWVGRTEHQTNPLPLKFWSPFKLYTSTTTLQAYYQKFGKHLSYWYDDFEYWTSFPRRQHRWRAPRSARSPLCFPAAEGSQVSPSSERRRRISRYSAPDVTLG